MNKKFYITTPIYYVNAKPHIGHAYTTVAADVLARFKKLQGEKVFFLTGTDEHGLKIQKIAEKDGKDPQKFVDEVAEEFKNLWSKEKLNIKYDKFIRTSDNKHKQAVQRVLEILKEKGAIEKGTYNGLYCEGCEQFKNENELVAGKCPDHDMIAENISEECWVLKMEDKQAELEEKIKNDEFEIRPERYKNEVLSFLKDNKLKNISISRSNVKWGIPLPFDKEQTTYVWIDAFLNYLTGLGWDGNLDNIPKEWPADVQLLGKDILRVHATIWPIMLLYLGMDLPKLFVHGHILSRGKKMSKTLGNAIAIEEMLEKFGTDGTRYLLLSAGVFGDDVDVTMERLIEKYNADLANGLGNLVSRVVKLMDNMGDVEAGVSTGINISKCLDDIRPDEALNVIWDSIGKQNKYIENSKPWELVKTDENKFNDTMKELMANLHVISDSLVPFMPETSEKIKKALEIKQTESLFQRIK